MVDKKECKKCQQEEAKNIRIREEHHKIVEKLRANTDSVKKKISLSLTQAEIDLIDRHSRELSCMPGGYQRKSAIMYAIIEQAARERASK